MALHVSHGDAILRSNVGDPAKPPTEYLVGFKTATDKVLDGHRDACLVSVVLADEHLSRTPQWRDAITARVSAFLD